MQNGTYQLTINDKFTFDLDGTAADQLDLIDLGGGQFHLLNGTKAYHAECCSLDLASKTVELKINGNHYRASIAGQLDLLVQKMGLSANIIHKISEIKAPMPGLVLSISAAEGQEVMHGDPLLILEAMKMENVIKSPGEGRVKKIHVTQGKPVEKGQLLIEME